MRKNFGKMHSAMIRSGGGYSRSARAAQQDLLEQMRQNPPGDDAADIRARELRLEAKRRRKKFEREQQERERREAEEKAKALEARRSKIRKHTTGFKKAIAEQRERQAAATRKKQARELQEWAAALEREEALAKYEEQQAERARIAEEKMLAMATAGASDVHDDMLSQALRSIRGLQQPHLGQLPRDSPPPNCRTDNESSEHVNNGLEHCASAPRNNTDHSLLSLPPDNIHSAQHDQWSVTPQCELNKHESNIRSPVRRIRNVSVRDSLEDDVFSSNTDVVSGEYAENETQINGRCSMASSIDSLDESESSLRRVTNVSHNESRNIETSTAAFEEMEAQLERDLQEEMRSGSNNDVATTAHVVDDRIAVEPDLTNATQLAARTNVGQRPSSRRVGSSSDRHSQAAQSMSRGSFQENNSSYMAARAHHLKLANTKSHIVAVKADHGSQRNSVNSLTPRPPREPRQTRSNTSRIPEPPRSSKRAGRQHPSGQSRQHLAHEALSAQPPTANLVATEPQLPQYFDEPPRRDGPPVHYEIKSGRTPTDDEINMLWDSLRQGLQAHRDIVPPSAGGISNDLLGDPARYSRSESRQSSTSSGPLGAAVYSRNSLGSGHSSRLRADSAVAMAKEAERRLLLPPEVEQNKPQSAPSLAELAEEEARLMQSLQNLDVRSTRSTPSDRKFVNKTPTSTRKSKRMLPPRTKEQAAALRVSIHDAAGAIAAMMAANPV